MVKALSSLTGSGMKDWYVQRLTAFILLLYVVILVVFMIDHGPIGYREWSSLFAHTWMKWFTLLAVFSIIFHAWVGIWTVFTDYVHCALIRGVLFFLIFLAFLACIAWTFMILWG